MLIFEPKPLQMELAAAEQIKMITSLYSEIVTETAKHPTLLDRNSHAELCTLYKQIAQFLNGAFAQNPALAAALHEIKKAMPLEEQVFTRIHMGSTDENDSSRFNLILPMSIPLPHHVVYIDEPAFDPLSLRRFALVRTTRGLKIVTRVVCSHPIYAQDFDFWMHRSPSSMNDFFLYTNKQLTPEELADMRPSMTITPSETGTEKMISSKEPAPPITQKQLALAIKAQMSRSQFRLFCGVEFYCEDIIWDDEAQEPEDLPIISDSTSQFYSPLGNIELGQRGRLLNYTQIEPLFDPFDDLIVARTTGFCAYLDKNSGNFKLGKVISQPCRTNRFHYTLERATIDLIKLCECLHNKPVLSVLGDCATVLPETFEIYCKFVCSLVGCESVSDDVLAAFIEENMDKDAIRELFVQKWVESVIGKWTNG